MASPFNVFRRNQRAMLAVAGVAIMIVFVLGDPITKYLGRAGGTENPVIVKANSHSYRASELIALVQSRSIVKNFLQQLAVEWVQKVAEAQKIPGQQVAAIAENVSENWRQELMARIVPPEIMPSEDDGTPRQTALSEEEASAIQTVVLAAAAEAQGIVVTDQAINDYLQTITRNLISPVEFETIVTHLHADVRNMSQAFLFDSLRRELLASRYSFMHRVSLASVLPSPRWEYFQQLNRRATAEVLPVAVEGFIKDVPEPGDAELKAFFEKHREALPIPNSPTPGFKRPTKAKFQYFLANYADFIERGMAKVTPEEIGEYYEKNKDIRYRQRKEPAAGDADDVKSDDTPPSDSNSGDASGDSPKGSNPPQKPAAEGQKPPAAGSGAAPAPPAGSDKKSSRSVPASSLHLVAQAQKPAAKTPAAPPAAKTPAAAPATQTPPAAAAPAPPADTPPTDTAADEKPAAATTDDKSGEGAASDAADADKPSDKKEVAYEPLEKVEGEIRKTLAIEKANRLINEAFQRLSAKMREYRSARGEYEVRKEEEPNLEEPDPLDLPALASAEGMEAKETDLVSADELYDATDLGKSFNDDIPDRRSLSYRKVPFPQIGFSDRLFNPEPTEDIEGNGYLSWKIKETPEGVPEFDEVRKEVVLALKLIEARKLAVAAAEQLAKEARKAEKPLNEVFDGREGLEKVVDTGPFTWMTIGPIAFDPGAQPRLSDVHGVESPGEEFMRAVFNATPTQISVALNEPKTVAYVIQVDGFEPPLPDLRQEFLLEDFRKYARLAINDGDLQYVEWLRWLDRQAGVTWLQPGYTSRRIAD